MTLNIIKKSIVMSAMLLLSACANWPHAAPADLAASPGLKTSTPAPASQTNGDDVQVFDLDGPAPAKDGVANGMASADPSVTIYPLDDGDSMAAGSTPMEAPDFPAPPPARSMSSVLDAATADTSGAARVYFGDNSSRLNKTAQHAVRQAAQGAGGVVSVEGHASSRTAVRDPVQARIVNLKLSMQRTIAVSRQLVARGVPASAIKMTAYGDTHPSPPADGKGGEAASRRVEIRSGAGSLSSPLTDE